MELFENAACNLTNQSRTRCQWDNDLRDLKKHVYPTILPILIAIAACGIITNALIVISSRRIPSKLSVNLRLCLSLAIADCTFCTLRMVSFSLDSYGGFIDVMKDPSEACLQSRFISALLVCIGGACLTSIFHLATIALNHLVGTTAPLKYKHCITRRRCNAVIAALWVVPTMFLSIFAAVIPKKATCTVIDGYRMVVPTAFAVLSSVVFLGVAGVYACIQRKLRNGANQALSMQQMRKHVDPAQVAESRRNVIRVTLLITVTFAIGWLPAFYWDALISWETMKSWLAASISPVAFLAVNVLRASLQLLKLLANPFIYTLRIPQIEKAVCELFSFTSGGRQVERKASVLSQQSAADARRERFRVTRHASDRSTISFS